jgi:ribokinase
MGETLHGSRFHLGFGGKGANQAVMAAKLGGTVSMISKLGKDVFGEQTLENFTTWGVDTTHVHTTDQAFSGVAPIAVDEQGNNSIIIVTGANDLLTVEEIEAARTVIREADILVCQLEIPLTISKAAMEIAKQEGTRTIFNPAPAQADLPEDLYRVSDIFCPNESETEILTGKAVESIEDAETAGRLMLEKGAETVIITLGERGSLLVSREETVHVAAETVKAYDTTGAGDAFVGSLAFFLSTGCSWRESIERANRIAAHSVTSSGTQTSFPVRKDLPAELFQ